MTTTEWVERYNAAFREAELFQDPDSKWKRMSYLEVKFTRGAPVRFGPSGGGTLFGDLGVSSGTPEEIAIPSNPSPFEPKEVVDDGPVGQNVLNQKEAALERLKDAEDRANWEWSHP